MVRKAVDLSDKLAAMPPRKLAASAFVREALEVAGATEKDIDRLESQPLSPEEFGLMNEVERLIAAGHIPAPFPAQKLHKLSAYSPNVRHDRLAILQAAAIRRVAKNPRLAHCFGTVARLDSFDAKVGAVQDELDQTFAEMRSSACGDDFLLDQDRLSPQERAKGMVIASFRNWPTVPYSPDWPRALVQAEREANPPKQKAEKAA